MTPLQKTDVTDAEIKKSKFFGSYIVVHIQLSYFYIQESLDYKFRHTQTRV